MPAVNHQNLSKPAESDQLIRIKSKLHLLKCPRCPGPTARLTPGESALLCPQCHSQYPIVNGIPVFSVRSDSLEIVESRKTISKYSVTKWRRWLELLLRTVVGTPLWLAFLIYLSVAKRRNFLFQWRTACAPEVAKWLSVRWVAFTPYNLYLKALETNLFSKVELPSPSLEIGGGGGDTSRLVFAGKRVDIDCEYFYHNIALHAARGVDVHAVTDLHIGGSVYNLPCEDASFNSAVMIHIADHLVDIETAFQELSRVLRPGGILALSTYSGYVFEYLPLFRLLRPLSEDLANRYRVWKCHRNSVWSSYGSLISDNPEDANGQNLYTISQWEQLGARHGLELIQSRPFTVAKVYTTLVDFHFRGDSRIFRVPIRRCISHFVESELAAPDTLSESEASNIFMVFRRQDGSMPSPPLGP